MSELPHIPGYVTLTPAQKKAVRKIIDRVSELEGLDSTQRQINAAKKLIKKRDDFKAILKRCALEPCTGYGVNYKTCPSEAGWSCPSCAAREAVKVGKAINEVEIEFPEDRDELIQRSFEVDDPGSSPKVRE